MNNKNPNGKITKVTFSNNKPTNVKPSKNFNIKRTMPKNTGRGR